MYQHITAARKNTESGIEPVYPCLSDSRSTIELPGELLCEHTKPPQRLQGICDGFVHSRTKFNIYHR